MNGIEETILGEKKTEKGEKMEKKATMTSSF